MILLSVQARLSLPPRRQAQMPPFIGCETHGMFERLVQLHAPAAFESLSQGQHKRCVLFVRGNVDGPTLRFGIGLFDAAAVQWRAIADAVGHADELWAGDWYSRISGAAVSVQIRPDEFVQVPTSERATHPQPQIDWMPPLAVAPTSARRVAVDLLSPAKLTTSTKRNEGRTLEPPSLGAFAASVRSRLLRLEPRWSGEQGFDDSAWPQLETALRAHQPDASMATPCVWSYRGKPLSGLVGRLVYRGPVPPSVMHLLQVGQWVSVGQGTAMGQGMYQVVLDEYADEVR